MSRYIPMDTGAALIGWRAAAPHIQMCTLLACAL